MSTHTEIPSEDELFATIQAEVYEWSEQNFPGQPAVNPLLGVAEEFGELADDLNETAPPTHEELDAVGDMLVYMADFCERNNVDYQAAYDAVQAGDVTAAFEANEIFRNGVSAYGALCHSVLKTRQDIRQDEETVGDEAEHTALAEWLAGLSKFANERGYTLSECVEVAFYDEVIDREWDSAYK